MSDIFDFGFTAVDESELDAVREAQSVISATTDTASGRRLPARNIKRKTGTQITRT